MSVEKGEEIASLLQVDSADWVITTPTGLFDATPKAMDLMHYVVYTEKAPELIGLEQLKARYYEPGLLSKLLGFSKETIRPVDKLETVDLYPEIVVAKMDEDNHLQIHLKERKGGSVRQGRPIQREQE